MITRAWAMPDRRTFRIPPIRAFIERHMTDGIWLDPFAHETPFAARCVTNDLDTAAPATFHEEALDFLARFAAGCAAGVLFDPPYSPRQISECYKSVGRAAHMEDTQSGFYSARKDAAARALRAGGIALTFGWNSNGFGKKRGFEITEILLVAHGGAHNDTICVAERKL